MQRAARNLIPGNQSCLNVRRRLALVLAAGFFMGLLLPTTPAQGCQDEKPLSNDSSLSPQLGGVGESNENRSLDENREIQKNNSQSQEPALQPDDLPWERKRQNNIPRLTDLTERDLLVDVSEEEELTIQDSQSIIFNQPLFAKLLFRISRFERQHFASLATNNESTELTDLELQPGFHRLSIFSFEGTAEYWEPRTLAPEIGELYDLGLYYKVRIRSKSGQNLLVYCLEIPDRWKKKQQITEDVRVNGLFLNLTESNGKDNDKEKRLNFIAARIQWIPQSPTELVTEIGRELLGSSGYDLGLLDTLKNQNKRQLENTETEAFYQMLKTTQHNSIHEKPPVWANKIPTFDLIQHLKQPAQLHGTLSKINLEIRNITRIQAMQEDIRNRIGIKQYFQLDGFVKFDSSVTYKTNDDKQAAVFKDKYPICVCINELPSGWKVGTDQRYQGTFPVFFYKIWAYPSGFQSQFSKEALQQSPLLIAMPPIEQQVASNTINWTTLFLYGALGLGVISIWTSFYLSKAKKDRSSIQFRLPSKVEIEPPTPTSESENGMSGMPVIREDENPQ